MDTCETKVGEGRRLGRFRLVAELGRGGMAEVHLAVTQGPGRVNQLVVIKQIMAQYAEDPDFVAMFLDEARLAARARHPNVVQTHEVGEEGGRYFMVMEYLEGQPLSRLRNRLGRARALPLGLHLRALAEVLAGLHHVHELGDNAHTRHLGSLVAAHFGAERAQIKAVVEEQLRSLPLPEPTTPLLRLRVRARPTAQPTEGSPNASSPSVVTAVSGVERAWGRGERAALAAAILGSALVLGSAGSSSATRQATPSAPVSAAPPVIERRLQIEAAEYEPRLERLPLTGDRVMDVGLDQGGEPAGAAGHTDERIPAPAPARGGSPRAKRRLDTANPYQR